MKNEWNVYILMVTNLLSCGVGDHKPLLSDINNAWKYESDAGWKGYEDIIITRNVAMVIFVNYMS